MRSYVVAVVLLLTSFTCAVAQDIIVLRNGEEIECIVKVIGEEEIDYVLRNQPNGPMRRVDKQNVFSIVYANGAREYISTLDVKDKAQDSLGRLDNYTSFGIGIGLSYSGYGIRLQQRFGSDSEYALFVSMGTLESEFGFVVGGKYFVWGDVYTSVAVGPAGIIEQTHIPTGLVVDSWLVYGPIVKLGGDWHYAEEFGFGLNFGLGVAIPEFNRFDPAFDLGIFLKW